MGIDLPKILAILPIGVIRRESSIENFITLDKNDSKSNQICLDRHDEYTFSNEAFCFTKPNQRAFFDGVQKILEYAYDGQNLSIQIFSSKQSNLFIDADVQNLDTHALGPLCIQGSCRVLHQYSIHAKSLSLDGSIVCKETGHLNVTEDLHTFGELSIQNFTIRAGYYQQSAKMIVHQYLDLTSQVFCQDEGAVLKTPTLRMIAEISRISGQFEIGEHCFSAVSNWILGGEGQQSILHFPDSHHIHVGALSIKNDTQVVIGEQDSTVQNSQWIVDDDIEVDETSSLTIYHGNLQCHKMICAGVAEIHDSNVAIKTLIQQGNLIFFRSKLDLKSIHIETGVFSAAQTYVSAKKINAMAGEFLVQDNCTLNVSDKFLSDKTIVKITDSDVSVKRVVLQGRSKIQASTIQSEDVSLSYSVSIKESQILVDRLQVQGSVSIENSSVKTKDIWIFGKLAFDNVKFDTNSIEYHSSSAILRRNFVRAKRIVLEGGKESGQFVFKSSRLIAKSFAVLEEVDIHDSTMIGIDDAKASHSIQGHLFLRNSRWVTHSRVRSLVGSHIHPCEYSEIIAGKITASGDMSVNESLVQCEELSLIGSNAILQSGDVIAENAAHIHRSKLSAHADSSMIAKSMHLSGQSHTRLKNSNLHLSGQLTTSHDSELDGRQSKISAGKMRFLGKSSLVKSLLSAEELIIYNNFSAQQSMVHAKEDIVLAGTAKAKMGDSALHGRNIESFGNVSLENTQLHARETAALWTGSKTSMAGASMVKADDVVLRGDLVTQNKNQKTQKKTTAKPTIIAQNHLDISPQSKISGNEDLILSADIVNQSGQIDLQTSLCAKGRRFDNLGSFYADSIDLRFDDALVNHGSISTKNLTIHSNLMNIFGRIYAEQSMSISGFVSLNLGLITANNYTNDSLASLNFGVIAPHLLADPRFIFSRNNLIGTARNLAMIWAPMHTSGIQFLFMLPSFRKTSSELYQKTEGFTRIFDLKRHEYMPMLCQIKSLMLLGQGMYASGNSLYNEEYVNWQTSLSKMYHNPHEYGQDWWQTFQGTNWQEFAINSAEALAGTYTDTSLLHANFGLSLGTNTLKTNWMHVNMGQERSLFSHNIATNMLYNRGQSTGSKSSFTADHIQNQGTLSGTQKFYLRSKTVNNTSEGHIKGTHALIDIEKMEQSGEFIVDEGRVHIGAFQDSTNASTTLNHSVLKGQILHEEGDIHLNDSKIQVDEIDIADDAHPELIDSFLIGQTVKDASHLSFGGDSGVMADDYQHQGFYTQLTQDGKKSTFSVKAKTASFQGGGDLENAVFEIDHFSDSAQFIAGVGAYSNYHIHQSLGWSTLDDVSLTNPISRDCDITVQAASIENQFDYNQAHQLSFISTVGDITFSRTLQGSNIYAYSARDILNHGQVLGTDKVLFQAGRNVENRGRIASGKYTQILAKGNVTNLCEEEAYQGQWDVRRNYKAAVITGGTGEDTEGVGLHIEADGEVISDASDFVSQGSNYIQGKKGVHFGARYRTYTSLEKTEFIPCGDPHKRFWRDPVNGVKVAYGKVRDKKIETIAIDTDVGLSHVVSGNGRNIIRSGEGEISSAGAQFVSPGGTDVYARGDVKLYGLQLNNKVHQNTNYRISIFNSSRDYYYQQSQPTLFVDNGTTRIHSYEGNVDARRAYFIGGGDLEIKAKKKILLGVDILNNETTEKTQSFGWSIPGKGAWDTYKQGGKIWDIGAAFDPSLSKANALYQSESCAERLASAANLGIDLANTGNSLMRGIAQGNITDELLARYGLGHDGHFAPSVSLSLTQRKTKTSFQTQAQGGIDRGGNVILEAGEGIDLENGVRVHAGKNLDINAPQIRAHAAKLQSTTQQTTVSESLGIVGFDGVESLGASIGQTKTSAESIVNAELSAGSDIHVHNNGGEIEVLELDGANINGQSISGKARTLIIRDQQNTSQTQTKSVSAATNGMFGGYKGKGHSRTTQQHSGIHTADSINANGHEFSAYETHMIGGSITTEGKNHFKTDILTTEILDDVEQYSGFRISSNFHDAERLLGGKPANRAGEPMIATASVQIDRKDFVAIEKPVIHGKQGTELSIQSLEGQLESQHDSGRVIQKDHSLHVQIDIPVTNHEFLTQISDNVHGVEVKLSALLHPKSQSQEPMAFGKPEPIVPVEDENSNTKLLPVEV